MKRISRGIWRTLGQALDVRALYLKDICRQVGLPLQGQNYLDIGTGPLVNSLVFGKDFVTTHCIDLYVPKKDISPYSTLIFVLGDAQALPFKGAVFDLISLISVIEHVEEQEQVVYEVFRALKPGGSLVIQIPNRYFPIELHSGLPNLLLCPRFLRRRLIRSLTYSRLADIDIPSRKSMLCLIHNSHANVLVNETKIIWPAVLVPKMFRGPYKILAWVGIFRLLPLGYLFICKVSNI